MSRLIEQEIAVLIEQSTDIAKHVHQQEWDTVEQLTEKRQLALEDFFNLPIPTNSIQLIETMIRNIMKIDHGLVEFIESEKKKTLTQFKYLRNNTKANQAYQNVASLNHL